jgi:hypothetical protein
VVIDTEDDRRRREQLADLRAAAAGNTESAALAGTEIARLDGCLADVIDAAGIPGAEARCNARTTLARRREATVPPAAGPGALSGCNRVDSIPDGWKGKPLSSRTDPGIWGAGAWRKWLILTSGVTVRYAAPPGQLSEVRPQRSGPGT